MAGKDAPGFDIAAFAAAMIDETISLASFETMARNSVVSLSARPGLRPFGFPLSPFRHVMGILFGLM